MTGPAAIPDPSPFSAQTALLQDGAVQMYRLLRHGRPLSRLDAFTLLRDDVAFGRFLSALIAAAPWPALRLELPGMTLDSSSEPLEFVLVRDITLERRADPQAFANRFEADPRPAIGFPNLGGDAYLVAPRPVVPYSDCAHLAALLRSRHDEAKQYLWQEVGAALLLRLNAQPIWLSTAGGGVPWLHVRFDTRPKYYAFRPYALSH